MVHLNSSRQILGLQIANARGVILFATTETSPIFQVLMQAPVPNKPDLRTLLRAQPITGTEPELLDSFDPADAGRQLGTQQARVCGFMSEAAHSGKLLVDGIGGRCRDSKYMR